MKIQPIPVLASIRKRNFTRDDDLFGGGLRSVLLSQQTIQQPTWRHDPGTSPRRGKVLEIPCHQIVRLSSLSTFKKNIVVRSEHTLTVSIGRTQKPFSRIA